MAVNILEDDWQVLEIVILPDVEAEAEVTAMLFYLPLHYLDRIWVQS